MINLEDILISPATCELSRVALSTPHEFLKQRFVKQERRKFLQEPEVVSGFYLTERFGPFPDAAYDHHAELGA